MRQLLKVKLALLISFLLIACGDGGIKTKDLKLIPVKSGSEFQYIDAKGKIIINPQFSEATVFRDGLALVKTSGKDPKYGYIKEDGKFEVKADFIRATVFSDGMAWVVTENSAPTAIDIKGERKFTLTNAEEVRNFSNGLAAFSEVNNENDEKWGFVNKKGEVVVNAQFSNVGEFQEGKCAVRNNDGKWGYIDKDGKIIMNPQFDWANSFSGNSAVVMSGGKAGLIDSDGKYIINPQYSKIIQDGNVFLIELDGKFGWVDKDGKITINPQFNEAYPFNGSDLAAVKSGNNFGYVNKEGKIMINPQFEAALPFNGKMAMVMSSNKLGFIDKDGKYLINPQYDETSRDLLQYFMLGTSPYNSIETDYFNMDVIKSRINILSLEGFKSNSNISDVLKAFKKSQDDISKYSTEHRMIVSERISNDATLDFYVLSEPWSQSGYYGPWTFDSGQKPSHYAYIVSLQDKGYGKADLVKSEIEASLKGFIKDESKSDETESFYKSANQLVKIYSKQQSVSIVITYFEDKDMEDSVDNTSYSTSASESSVDDEDFYPDGVYRISDPDGFSNLRDKPNGAIIRKVLESEEFSVIGNQNKHEKVQLSDGTIGFIQESRVVSSVNYKVNLKNGVTNINVRDNYGANKTSVITQISAPMALTVSKEFSLNNNGKTENWIYLNEVKGWILSDFVN